MCKECNPIVVEITKEIEDFFNSHDKIVLKKIADTCINFYYLIDNKLIYMTPNRNFGNLEFHYDNKPPEKFSIYSGNMNYRWSCNISELGDPDVFNKIKFYWIEYFRYEASLHPSSQYQKEISKILDELEITMELNYV